MESVGDAGWLMTTWVMFFGARTMILLDPFPPIMMNVLTVGAVLIVLSIVFPLSKFKKHGVNLIVLPLDIVGNFVDVVSYVRLFAVGMATSMPPHNLMEVCQGIISTIEDPEISVEELMEIIKGPDFPTGGIITDTSGIYKAMLLDRETLQ